MTCKNIHEYIWIHWAYQTYHRLSGQLPFPIQVLCRLPWPTPRFRLLEEATRQRCFCRAVRGYQLFKGGRFCSRMFLCFWFLKACCAAFLRRFVVFRLRESSWRRRQNQVETNPRTEQEEEEEQDREQYHDHHHHHHDHDHEAEPEEARRGQGTGGCALGRGDVLFLSPPFKLSDVQSALSGFPAVEDSSITGKRRLVLQQMWFAIFPCIQNCQARAPGSKFYHHGVTVTCLTGKYAQWPLYRPATWKARKVNPQLETCNAVIQVILLIPTWSMDYNATIIICFHLAKSQWKIPPLRFVDPSHWQF